VYFIQIYVSTNVGVSVSFLWEICFLVCSVDQPCRFEVSLFPPIYVEGVAKYFVGQLDNSLFCISKD